MAAEWLCVRCGAVLRGHTTAREHGRYHRSRNEPGVRLAARCNPEDGCVKAGRPHKWAPDPKDGELSIGERCVRCHIDRDAYNRITRRAY